MRAAHRVTTGMIEPSDVGISWLIRWWRPMIGGGRSGIAEFTGLKNAGPEFDGKSRRGGKSGTEK